MQINREPRSLHTIQSYSDTQITLNHTSYSANLIISRCDIISPWAIHSVFDLNEESLTPMLAQKPEVILIGHTKGAIQLPMPLVQYLANLGIGIENMSIGAACRTFNVLLSEQREVVLGIVFANP
ncbi:MAG TPA: hypothetical protein DDY37_01005 [Legionella sp.]|nr:hypothetical protein [Legionella sp.]